ncbi:Glycosyltransferase involved in cell wall bisynthesis [Marinobacter subterrani]|uniref:Glycosyltransferase involved in cell wall bisynthesis n=2 Tax=Marinobacter subterrani TaxID=1658765 RepID=A0A0J7J9Q4_9GAMM|nr:Glycosyltransferase involved in cell wall bisynthesis [Marinobacter subterrani]
MIIAYMYELQVYPPRGGNHRHAYELVSGFIAKAHEVRVLNDPTAPGAQNFPHDHLDGFLEGADVLYVRIDARPVRNTLFEEVIKQARCPVVWEVNAPANEALAYSWLGGKLDLRKESPLKQLKRFVHALRQYPRIYLEESTRKALSKKVSAHICVTRALAQYSKIRLAARSTVVNPNGGNPLPRPASNEEAGKEKRFTVLYSGSAMYPWQGLHYLNEVTAKALEQEPEVEFVFCVSSHPEAIVQRANTTIHVGLPHDQILSKIGSADVCIALYPDYPWSPWGLHNSPMKLFEYFGCGAATITSNLGQMKDLFTGKNVCLLTENTPEAILTNIQKIKRNPLLKKQLQENAYRLITEEMGWDRVVEKTLNVFEEALDEAR